MISGHFQNGSLFDQHSCFSLAIYFLARCFVMGMVTFPEMFCRLEDYTGLKIRDDLCAELDVCKFTEKTRHGLLSTGTTLQIKNALSDH